MALINVNNSSNIEVESRSIQLHSEIFETGRYLDVSHVSLGDVNVLTATLVDLADGDAPIDTLRAATYALRAMLTHSRSLYNLQSMLNDPMWKVLGITVEVEAKARRRGTTNEYSKEPHMILLVKTTWQEEGPTPSNRGWLEDERDTKGVG